jgi:hypothetical protein
MFRLLLFVAVSIYAAGANAQKAEEAVALITQGGLEPGSAVGNLCGDIQAPKVTPGSPAKYRFDCDGDWFETAFRQIDGCRFETLVTSNRDEMEKRDVLDFSKFRGLLPARGNAATMGHFFDASPDFCTSSDGKICMIEFTSMGSGECCVLAGWIPHERVASALSLISKNCGQ